MPRVSSSKIFNRYLPLALAVLLIVGAAFVYQVFNKNTQQARAGWYGATSSYEISN